MLGLSSQGQTPGADFPVCRFTELSSPVSETPDWKVRRTGRLESLPYEPTFCTLHSFPTTPSHPPFLPVTVLQPHKDGPFVHHQGVTCNTLQVLQIAGGAPRGGKFDRRKRMQTGSRLGNPAPRGPRDNGMGNGGLRANNAPLPRIARRVGYAVREVCSREWKRVSI